jgi:signal peptidase I
MVQTRTPSQPRHDRSDRGGHHRGHGSFLAELPVLILVAFVLALLLKTFLVQAFYIPSESMVPTLEIGDRVLVNKVVYDLRAPRRGEVVVFSDDEGGSGAPPVSSEPNVVKRFARSLAAGLGLAPAGERDFIKRIIGLPGDSVEMRDGVVYVNGEALPEAPADEGGYLSSRDLNPYGPFTVPQGHYFMMGDNRPNSSDSRFSLGPIPEDAVVGRAFVIIWPVPRASTLPGADYGLVEQRPAVAQPVR